MFGLSSGKRVFLVSSLSTSGSIREWRVIKVPFGVDTTLTKPDGELNVDASRT